MWGSQIINGTLGQAARIATTRLLFRRQAVFWARQVTPGWTWRQTRAEVVRVDIETADTKTFWLRPNRHWRGHRAGQYTLVTAEIGGVWTQRCYSIASEPGGALLALTIKRKAGGTMSSWLHANVQPGAVLALGPAMGDFVIAESRPPDKLAFLTAGSGITPAMSILRDLVRRGTLPDSAFVHYARTAADIMFADELRAIAAANPQLCLAIETDDGTHGGGPFDESRLLAIVPDLAERETYLCGPAPLMDRVAALWDVGYANPRLHAERFAPPTPAPATDATHEGVRVTLTAAERVVNLSGGGSLLEALEGAGEKPAHGCRIGICHTCKCMKRSGTVENLLTGAISDGQDETIQLCVSRARSDLVLTL